MAVVSPQVFAFVFPAASGHLNPSLAIARPLVESGHEVHYFAMPVMRAVIEGVGATFHSIEDYLAELLPKPELGLFGNLGNLVKEHGLGNNIGKGLEFLKNVILEKKLPGTLRFLNSIGARAVVYCPLVNREAGIAASIIGIPSIALNTIAGPGAATTCFMALRETNHEDPMQFIAQANAFEPELAATRRVNAAYGLSLVAGIQVPIGKTDAFSQATLNLITTSDDLMDPMSPDLASAYAAEGTKFIGVGPLLDREGMARAGGYKLDGSSIIQSGWSNEDILAAVRAARAAGRKVVMVSMGTVITGDMPQLGWEGRKFGADGQVRGLTGRELCRGAWAGAFDAFGASAEQASAETAPLLVVALGPQADPLGDLKAPSNAICAPVLPQVDILRIGVDLFLTHGGQNSFTESLLYSTPVVVCPGAGDQKVNAAKAVALGVGLSVDRPDPEIGQEAEAAEAYRADISKALCEVLACPGFVGAAQSCAERLRSAGGVPRALELILTVAASGAVGKQSIGGA